MRELKDLVKDNEQVWIYCENESLQSKFLNQAETEGFMALNGQKPTELFHHQLYGINSDMTMGYLAIMIWCLSFPKDGSVDPHLRVNYEKYISGEEDYICHTPYFKQITIEEFDKISYAVPDADDFNDICTKFNENLTFEEYLAYVYRYLRESHWKYSSEDAFGKVLTEKGRILKHYNAKETIADCATEIA